MDWTPALFSSLSPQHAVDEMLALRRFTEPHGLTLTPAQAQMLAQTRQRALRETGRLEFGGSILPKLMLAFYTSPYLSNFDFADTLAELTVLFYALKNELMDCLTDDELIGWMREGFDGPCQGTVELLAGQWLEELMQALRGRQEDGGDDGNDTGWD